MKNNRSLGIMTEIAVTEMLLGHRLMRPNSNSNAPPSPFPLPPFLPPSLIQLDCAAS